MTTPPPSAAEIERLAAEAENESLYDGHGADLAALLARCARALRTIPDLISDADNDRSRYKAQIEGLERERDEMRAEIAERTRDHEDLWKRLVECERERDEAQRMLAEAISAQDEMHTAFVALGRAKPTEKMAAKEAAEKAKQKFWDAFGRVAAAAKEKPDG